ncbi:MAG: hypothetical protein A3F18_00320 [Legionellales bacterium RIFCSPHIGHO2_12_FULL_37_14]|nr:MAG: hypothetical protein A3F18_00320 [Legionellales bacterium RIFCSPHIGHO2_12_FULL_37_14]
MPDYDTHNPAAQASAGWLILLLRNELGDAGPTVESQNTSNTTPNTNEERLTKDDKEYLCAFLNAKITNINSSFIEGQPVTTSPYISSIVAFVDYIEHHQTESPFNDPTARNAVFSEMINMINSGCDQWTKNGFYVDGKKTIVDASLGETLGLVCSALHGEDVLLKQRYHFMIEANLQPNETLETRLVSEHNSRMLSLFNCLKNLSADRKCTAGRQHDLLNLLNGVYPEVQKDGTYKPILLIENITDFIVSKLSAYLSSMMKKWPEPLRVGLMRNWALYATGHDDDNQPMKVLMKKLKSKESIEKISAHLEEISEHYGLSPENVAVTISQAVAAIDDLDPPNDLSPIVPCVMQILRTVKDDEPSSYCNARNAAREKLIALLKNPNIKSFEKLEPMLQYFIEAEMLYQSVKKHHTMSTLIEEEDNSSKALESLKVQLEFSFKQLLELSKKLAGSLDGSSLVVEIFKHQRTDLQTAYSRFVETKKTLENLIPYELVCNFFAMMNVHQFLNYRQQDAQIDYLKQLLQKKSFKLSDRVLKSFIAKVLTAQDTGAIVEITPYEINRILLHGLFTYYQQDAEEAWTLPYKTVLLETITWLIAQKQSHTTHNEQKFVENYPDYLLTNLLVMALTWDIPCCRAQQKTVAISNLFYNFDNLLNALFNCAQTKQERDAIFNAIENHLNLILRTKLSLSTLFTLDNNHLSEAQRDIILERTNLKTLIKDLEEMGALFRLDLNKLSEKQRSTILLSIDLPTLIPTAIELNHILQLKYLSNQQKALILQAINLQDVIKNEQQFFWLFQLDEITLPFEHRNMILSKLNISDVINNDGLELVELLCLNTSQVSEEQFNSIWQTIKVKLNTLITNSNQLIDILEVQRLSPAQRSDVWNFAKNNLKRLIHNSEQFFHLLYNMDSLNLPWNFIYAAVEDRLSTFILNTHNLVTLFKCPRVSDTQRKQVLKALQSRLNTVIENKYDLVRIFKLNTTQLPSEERTFILQEVNLKSLLSGNSLLDLCELGEPRLSTRQRDLILTVAMEAKQTIIKNAMDLWNFLNGKRVLPQSMYDIIFEATDLSAIITSGYALNLLLSIENSGFSEQQREKVWQSVEDRLNTLVLNANELRNLFKLNTMQLSQEKRAIIWRAVKDNKAVTDGLSEDEKNTFVKLIGSMSSSSLSL